MTSLREALIKLLGGAGAERLPANSPDVSFSYRLFWTKQVRDWPEEKRIRVDGQVQELLRSPEFTSNAYNREYGLPEADDQLHAGASIESLAQVLLAFREFET